MPPEETNWLDHSEEQLAIKNCAYWRCLSGCPDTINSTTINVDVHKTAIFSPTALLELLDKTDKGLPL